MHETTIDRSLFSRFGLIVVFVLISAISFAQNEKLQHSLDYINEQFKKYNHFNLQFQLDVKEKKLTSKSVYFEVSYPVDKLALIYYKKRGDKDCILFFMCQDEEQCITALNTDDNTTETKSEYSFNIESSSEIAEKVVAEFLSIKNSIMNPNQTEQVNPSSKTPELNSYIEYINKLFKKYNSFNIQYSIDWNNKLLLSQSEYFVITYEPSTLNPVTIISRGENDFKINFSCKSEEPCLKSTDNRDNETELISNYPVNFTGSIVEAQKTVTMLNYIIQNIGK